MSDRLERATQEVRDILDLSLREALSVGSAWIDVEHVEKAIKRFKARPATPKVGERLHGPFGVWVVTATSDKGQVTLARDDPR